MTDLGNRFADGARAPAPPARQDDLDRLRQPLPAPEREAGGGWMNALKGRTDIIAASCAIAAACLVVWPHVHPASVRVPVIAETGDDVATLKVQSLWDTGAAVPPDWYGLFDAYQLETALRDISIRCNYGLPVDARVDRYLHARLETGSEVRIFLADPGTCPKT